MVSVAEFRVPEFHIHAAHSPIVVSVKCSWILLLIGRKLNLFVSSIYQIRIHLSHLSVQTQLGQLIYLYHFEIGQCIFRFILLCRELFCVCVVICICFLISLPQSGCARYTPYSKAPLHFCKEQAGIIKSFQLLAFSFLTLLGDPVLSTQIVHGIHFHVLINVMQMFCLLLHWYGCLVPFPAVICGVCTCMFLFAYRGPINALSSNGKLVQQQLYQTNNTQC